MKILLSPTKQMREAPALPHTALPCLLLRTEELLERMLELSPLELKSLWGCSDKLVLENLARLQNMDLRQGLTPALFAYEGIAFKYLAPEALSPAAMDYLQEHLRILSGFYGLLRPQDGIASYRLEMQAKLQTAYGGNLYDFWGSSLREALSPEPELILNLASKEYSRCIEAHCKPGDEVITCVFAQLSGGKLVQKGVYAKMARGAMTRFLAENAVTEPEGVKEFHSLGFAFDASRSGPYTYVFIADEVTVED